MLFILLLWWLAYDVFNFLIKEHTLGRSEISIEKSLKNEKNIKYN